jgi:hypothetical protein
MGYGDMTSHLGPVTAAAWPKRGVLVTDGWGDRQEQPVIVEGETPQRYRVRAVNEELRLPLRGNGVRLILRSGTVLVPKNAVRLEAK